MALEYNRGAYFPVVLSLIKLHLRSLWYILGGGKQPSLILWGEDTDNDRWWPKLWKADSEPLTEEAKPKVDVGEEDPIKRARDIRDAAIGIGDEEDPGEDYFDGMTRRRVGDGEGEIDEFEDDWELVVLALLAMGIASLVMLRRYYEQRRRLAWERDQRERRQRQQREQGGQDIPDDPVNQPPPPPAPDRLGLEEALQPGINMFL